MSVRKKILRTWPKVKVGGGIRKDHVALPWLDYSFPHFEARTPESWRFGGNEVWRSFQHSSSESFTWWCSDKGLCKDSVDIRPPIDSDQSPALKPLPIPFFQSDIPTFFKGCGSLEDMSDTWHPPSNVFFETSNGCMPRVVNKNALLVSGQWVGKPMVVFWQYNQSFGGRSLVVFWFSGRYGYLLIYYSMCGRCGVQFLCFGQYPF